MTASRRPYRHSRLVPFPDELRDQEGDVRLSHRLEQARRRLRKVSETLSCVTRDLREAHNNSLLPGAPEDEGERDVDPTRKRSAS